LREYRAVELRIGGAVHVVSCPEMELLCVDGASTSVSHSFSMEIIGGGDLEMAFGLFTHE
jgi:hypothetical protein